MYDVTIYLVAQQFGEITFWFYLIYTLSDFKFDGLETRSYGVLKILRVLYCDPAEMIK